MPFGLKNAGATYQREKNSIFHDFIDKFMQIFIDDIVVKSSSGDDHLGQLRLSFERMKKYGLKMNPLKCAFGVCAGDFLAFVVHQKSIEVNQNKTKAILETEPPSTKKELQSLMGKINFLRRFISNLSGKTQAFSPILRLKKEDNFRHVINGTCSNNETEYEALIVGLEILLGLGADNVVIKGYSKLVVKQLTKEYKCISDNLFSYFVYANSLLNNFESFNIQHVPRIENQVANDLAQVVTPYFY